MTTSTNQRRLLSLHGRQMKLFDRALAAIRREYRREPRAQEFLGTLTRLADTLHEQTASAQGMFTLAAALPEDDENRSPAFVRAYSGIHAYNFLIAKRKLLDQAGDLDREAPAFKASMAFTDGMTADDPGWGRACENGWQMSACHYQIGSLLRQAQAIQSTQEALLRSFGIRFWLSHTNSLRWDGYPHS